MAGRVNLTNNTVIDVTVLQAFADAINDHDDRLIKLSQSIASATGTSVFDFSRDMIASGVLSVPISAGEGYLELNFGCTFADVPKVVATPALNADNTYTWAITLSAITSTKCHVRVERNDGGGTGSGTVSVQWIAIGTR